MKINYLKIGISLKEIILIYFFQKISFQTEVKKGNISFIWLK